MWLLLMPKVPERKLSYGELLEKNRKSSKRAKRLATKDFAEIENTRITKNASSGYVKVRKRKELPKEIKEAHKNNYLLNNQYRRIMND